jgi:ABC-type nickel/cobalt efflux system permease component RcnA
MILRNFISMFSALLLSLALVTLPSNFSSFHFPLDMSDIETDRHAALEQVEDADHGHSHDDGEPFEKASGHSHGHDPADHSHQVAFVSHHTTDTLQKLDVIRFVETTDLVTLDLGSGLERPPKRNVRI